ncbi:MAG: hypothetical protein R2828_00545 [Saprospiraceae bacterium]
MKKNYKILINPKQPSQAQIAKHMDFDALLEQLDTNKDKSGMGRIRKLYYYGGAIAASISLLVVFWLSNQQNGTQTALQYFAERPYVNPPIKNVNPQFASYKVAVNQGGIYEYESGSRLVVPAAAFIDDRGKLIEGEVEIHYREMHDYIDFFLSGIPMTYDSANVRYTLESAGMIEIYAEKEGKRVNMAPGKHIDISLISQIDVPNINIPPSFNIYKLDTSARKWVYQDIDQLAIIDDVLPTLESTHPAYAVLNTYKTQLNLLDNQKIKDTEALNSRFPQPIAPIRPQRAEGNLPTFGLSFEGFSILLDEQSISAEERQTLRSQIENIIWEVSAKNTNFDTRALQVEWEGARLRKLQAWEYEITYFSGSQEVAIIINRVLTGDLFNQAIAQYEQDLEIYNAALTVYNQNVSQEKVNIESQYLAAKDKLKEDFLQALATTQTGETKSLAQDLNKRRVSNQFRATGFGIWNCDRPVPPLEQVVRAKFVDQNGKVLRNLPGYLVDKTRNTIERFLATKNIPIAYNTLSDNMLWLITEDQKIALIKPAQFKAIPSGAKRHTFQVEILEETAKEEKDIRRMLEF